MPASSSGRTALATSPWTNSAFVTPLRSALSTARSTASATTSTPYTWPAPAAIASAIEPMPEYRSQTISSPPRPASSMAIS